MKKLLIAIVTITLMFSTYTTTFADRIQSNIKIIINEKELISDQPPIVVNSRTYVPMRAIFEAFDYSVLYEAGEGFKKITATKENDRLLIEFNSNIWNIESISSDGTEIKGEMNIAPIFTNNRLMLPVRLISETLGKDVIWDGNSQTVVIEDRPVKKPVSDIKYDIFPSETDYTYIKSKFYKEFGNVDDLVIREGVFSENDLDTHAILKDTYHYIINNDYYAELFGAKYLYAEMPIDKAEIDDTYYIDRMKDKKVDGYKAFMYYMPHEPFNEIGLNYIGYDVILSENEYRQWSEENLRRRYEEEKTDAWVYYKELLGKGSEYYWECIRAREVVMNFILKEIIKEDMTDVEKVKAVHDWIIKNSAYDTVFENKLKNNNLLYGNTGDESYLGTEVVAEESGINGILIRKRGICEDFAETFKAFMDMLDIQCEIVSGVATNLGKSFNADANHAWNVVKIDDEWYHIDVTWDNPSKNTITGRVLYDYFMLSDTQMSRKRNWSYGWYDAYKKELDTNVIWYDEFNGICDKEIDISSLGIRRN